MTKRSLIAGVASGVLVAGALLLTPARAGETELKRMLSAIGTAEGAGWRVEWRAPLR